MYPKDELYLEDVFKDPFQDALPSPQLPAGGGGLDNQLQLRFRLHTTVCSRDRYRTSNSRVRTNLHVNRTWIDL